MKRNFNNLLMTLFALGLLLSASESHAGGTVGNGGDAVECRTSSINKLKGYYSLDYLLYLNRNSSQILFETSDLTKYLAHIQTRVDKYYPERSKHFATYVSYLFKDLRPAPYIWIPLFGNYDVKDEDMRTTIPENCRLGSYAALIQAVIRTEGSNNSVAYTYVPDIINLMSPLQQSFLIVHEWLWDFDKDVSKNREVNYFLHLVD